MDGGTHTLAGATLNGASIDGGTVTIPAGQTVTFAPRGLHVMFAGLTAPWKAGDHIPATLVFETAGAVPVIFNVEPRKGAGEGMGDMEGMDHGTMEHD